MQRGSGFDVALASAGRTMPMFLLGASSVAVAVAVNRKDDRTYPDRQKQA
jgi:hypothetical protein